MPNYSLKQTAEGWLRYHHAQRSGRLLSLALGTEKAVKTNHRRGFKAKTHTDNAMWAGTRVDSLSDKRVTASITNDFSKGRRGEAKAKRGAKKFITSRTRFNQKSAVRKLAKGEPE